MFFYHHPQKKLPQVDVSTTVPSIQVYLDLLNPGPPNCEQYILVGGFNPSEKYEFVSWEGLSHILWKNKSHVRNHQPDSVGKTMP